jgi:hypothetical protein
VIDAGACPLEPTTVIDLTAMGNGGDAVSGAAGPRRPGGHGSLASARLHCLDGAGVNTFGF